MFLTWLILECLHIQISVFVDAICHLIYRGTDFLMQVRMIGIDAKIAHPGLSQRILSIDDHHIAAFGQRVTDNIAGDDVGFATALLTSEHRYGTKWDATIKTPGNHLVERKIAGVDPSDRIIKASPQAETFGAILVDFAKIKRSYHKKSPAKKHRGVAPTVLSTLRSDQARVLRSRSLFNKSVGPDFTSLKVSVSGTVLVLGVDVKSSTPSGT